MMGVRSSWEGSNERQLPRPPLRRSPKPSAQESYGGRSGAHLFLKERSLAAMGTMIAFCGLHCAECEAYLATQAGDNDMRADAAKQWPAHRA